MADYSEEWRKITGRWRLGRRLGVVHLIAGPILIYLVSFPVTWFAPRSWLIRGAPVWYFIISFVLWLLIFIHLLWRDRYYQCPQCATRVRPFAGTDIPDWNPHPCPKCGLRAPAPPY